MPKEKTLCPWALSDPLSRLYHNEEWGLPCHDDHRLFEFLILEGMQAGLSWRTILQKREAMRKAFANFEPKKIIRFNAAKVEKLLQNEKIIRNRLKVNSVIQNAKGFLAIQKEFGNFHTYLWAFVDNKPMVNHWEKSEDVPAKTELSDKLSKDLKKRGFNFVGSTICYAYMQAIGLVNDHLTSCFRHKLCK